MMLERRQLCRGFEQTAKDRSSFCAAVHRQLLEDVSEDFASASAVLKALKTAKQKLQEEYRQAFVHLSLPDVFGFFVEHSTLRFEATDERTLWPHPGTQSSLLEHHLILKQWRSAWN
eukprot:g29591.t1